MGNNADDFAVTKHLAEIVFNALLAQIITPFLAGFGESFSFRFVPDRNNKTFLLDDYTLTITTVLLHFIFSEALL